MDACTPRARRTAPPSGRVIGWRLEETERSALLERFPPIYPHVMANHVTLKMGARPREPLPPACRARIVGEADDEAGVQCLVVEIDGSVVRPDGGVFHATWSLDRDLGRRAIESNGVIAWCGWRTVEPAELTLTPGQF